MKDIINKSIYIKKKYNTIDKLIKDLDISIEYFLIC